MATIKKKFGFYQVWHKGRIPTFFGRLGEEQAIFGTKKRALKFIKFKGL